MCHKTLAVEVNFLDLSNPSTLDELQLDFFVISASSVSQSVILGSKTSSLVPALYEQSARPQSFTAYGSQTRSIDWKVKTLTS